MFRGCSNLTTIDLSDFDTHNVEWLEGLFAECTKLQEIKFPENFTTEKVKSMGYMFYNCTSLPAIDLSGFNTQNVIYFHNMFVNCNAMTTLDLSHFNLSSVLLATGFVTGENFERIFMPDLNPDMQYTIREAWVNCPNADVLVPSNYYDVYKELCIDDSHYKRLLPLHQIIDEDNWKEGWNDNYPGAYVLRRTLTANKWDTFCMPFNISSEQIKEIFGEDTKIARYDTYDLNYLVFVSTDSIKEGIPYLIRPAKTVKDPIFVDVQALQWYPTPCYSKGADRDSTAIVFHGNLCKNVLNDESYCVLGTDRKFHRVTGSEEERTLKGTRAYFSIFKDLDVRILKVRIDNKSIVQEKGDVNDDGETTVSDAQTIVNFTLQKIHSGVDSSIADVNGDGEVTIADAQIIVNVALRIKHWE